LLPVLPVIVQGGSRRSQKAVGIIDCVQQTSKLSRIWNGPEAAESAAEEAEIMCW
jgi:hypothetical protein